MRLRKIFGMSEDKVWQQLCEQLGGTFIKGSLLNSSQAHIPIKQGTIILDSYYFYQGKWSAYYTRIRAPYLSKDGFRFKIHSYTFFRHLLTYFGRQGIKVDGFDHPYFITGNDESKVRALCANARIRQLIDMQLSYSNKLCVKDGEPFDPVFTKNTHILSFEEHGIIKDPDRLKSLIEMFTEILTYLCC